MNSFFRLILMMGALAAYPLASFAQESREEMTVEPIPALVAAWVAGEQTIAPAFAIRVPAAVSRSPDDMDASVGLTAPFQGLLPPFRPTTTMAEYLAAKSAPLLQGPGTGRQEPESLAPLAPPTLKFSFEGVNQQTAGGSFPPDTHGATGPRHFFEITNQHVDIYLKALPNIRVRSTSLASFFGYFTRPLFDPRAVYDRTWNRWVITAEAFPESASVQRYFIAISKTDDPLGAYFIYNTNATQIAGVNNFFDFPQLGMDQDAVIVTANVFGPTNAFLGPRMVAIAKARLYNGLGFFVPVFSLASSFGTLAPPLVLDQNAKTFLISARPNANTLQLFTLLNSSNGFGATLTGPANVPVAAYTMPPAAVQCGGAGGGARLDTGDSRFVTAGTQNGAFLWQVHSIDFFGAAVRWYKIDTSTNAVAQTKTHFQSGISSDSNASIAANDGGDIYLNWSSTSRTVCPQVVFTGDKAGVLPPTAGTVLAGSPTALTGNFDPNFGLQRFGDYSAVTVDPSNSLRACLVNEKVNAANVWGSRIGCVGF